MSNRQIIVEGAGIDPTGGGITMPNTGLPAEQVIWAYRLLLEREPESQGVIDQYIQAQSTRDLVDNILGSPEFRSKHPLFSAPLVL